MQHNYSGDSATIVPGMLDERAVSALGRVVRAVAEMEALLSTYIQVHGRLSEGHVLILLGRAAITRKIDIARSFATAVGGETLERFRQTLGSERTQAVLEVRNIVAHSTFIGLTVAGEFAFKTAKLLSLATDEVQIEAVTLAAADLERAATDAEEMVANYPAALNIAQAHADRGVAVLGPHVKAPASKK